MDRRRHVRLGQGSGTHTQQQRRPPRRSQKGTAVCAPVQTAALTRPVRPTPSSYRPACSDATNRPRSLLTSALELTELSLATASASFLGTRQAGTCPPRPAAPARCRTPAARAFAPAPWMAPSHSASARNKDAQEQELLVGDPSVNEFIR